jgi:DNA-binding NarL/FixJ family response regulator
LVDAAWLRHGDHPGMPSGAIHAVLDHAGYVYGAATAACADSELAEAITERVLASAFGTAGGERLDRARLVEEAVLLAVRIDPSPPFAGLPVEEREVIALARLGGCSAKEIALALEISVESVKAAMRSGLVRLAGAREHAVTG